MIKTKIKSDVFNTFYIKKCVIFIMNNNDLNLKNSKRNYVIPRPIKFYIDPENNKK